MSYYLENYTFKKLKKKNYNFITLQQYSVYVLYCKS